MKLRTLTAEAISNKTVLVRADFNVPLSPEGTIVDDWRVTQALPTLEFLLKHQSKVVVISHLGRPQSPNDKSVTLKPVATLLTSLLKQPVQFLPSCVGSDIKTAINEAAPGSLTLLENLRYHDEEEQNQAGFARALAELADVYVNEAFSVSHRAHASVAGVTKHLTSYAGYNLAAEIKALTSIRDNPRRPLVAVIGGAKISDKVEAIVNLAQIADLILIGGGVANNFLKADGLEIHKSFLQDAPADLKQKGINYIHVAQGLLEKMKTEKVLVDGFIPVPKILYPLDVIAARSPESTKTEVIELLHNAQDTPNDKDLMYLDIGPKTTQLYREIISQAKTIFWNGPMGVWENPAFAEGTRSVAQAIVKATSSQGAHSIIGGGDTLAAVDNFKLRSKFSYVSTAGGASLEFLAGKVLPGIEPLRLT